MLHALYSPDIKGFLSRFLENASDDILIYVAKNCSFKDAIEYEDYRQYVIQVNIKILDSLSIEIRDTASGRFISNLIKRGISLFPCIKDYLDKLSKQKSNGQSISSFSIFRYLNRFCEEFPADACKYLLNVYNSNTLEDLNERSHNMFALMENLFGQDLPLDLRNSLIHIVKECAESKVHNCEYQAKVLMQRYKIT